MADRSEMTEKFADTNVSIGVSTDRGRDDTVAAQGIGQGLEHRVYASFEDAEAIREEWDRFVEDLGADVFSSFDWCAVWWSHYGKGRRLEIHVVRQGGRLIGLVPVVRERWWWGLSCRTVRLVGCDTSPGSLYVTVSPDRMGDVIPLILRELDRTEPWDLICFHRLGGYFDHSERLARVLSRGSAVRAVRYHDSNGAHIVFELPATYEAWLAGLTSKERTNIKRRNKLLEKKHAVKCRTIFDGPELRAAAATVVELHQDQWRSRSRPGTFAEWPEGEAFYWDTIESQKRRGRVMIVEVRADDQVIGAEYNLCFGKRAHWMVSARDSGERWRVYSPGRLAFCALVRAAIEKGMSQIDALIGNFHYKLLLGGKSLNEQAIWVFRRGLGARCRVCVFRLLATLVHVCYAKIWAFGIGRKLGLVRYPHWQTWIRSEFDRRLRSRARWITTP